MPLNPPDTHSALQDVPHPTGGIASSTAVIHGRSFPPQQQILLYAAEEWEEFIREWVHSQTSNYMKVVRLTGAGDQGIDVAGLTDDAALHGAWDCFQCKHYAAALAPTTAYPEIGKILWYSYLGHYKSPRAYYFIAPKGCGQKLQKLLLGPQKLSSAIISGWEKYCRSALTATEVPLEGEFKTYVEAFDFSIFSYRTPLEIIDAHRSTPYYVSRFGSGLPNRPSSTPPPPEIGFEESEYVKRLFEVYSEECGDDVPSSEVLKAKNPRLQSHLDRQREYFYSAEALRNFARDAVPQGTFEDLQNEVFDGVVDIEQASHSSAMTRLNSVTQAASGLSITANGLISVTRVQDRKGICHQLANHNRLRWKISGD